MFSCAGYSQPTKRSHRAIRGRDCPCQPVSGEIADTGTEHQSKRSGVEEACIVLVGMEPLHSFQAVHVAPALWKGAGQVATAECPIEVWQHRKPVNAQHSKRQFWPESPGNHKVRFGSNASACMAYRYVRVESELQDSGRVPDSCANSTSLRHHKQ
eukprot:scaffold255347_cov48-Prasinocladus_malaysianus.AAC.1